MDRHIKVFSEIVSIVDRCNPAGRTCSIEQMTKALLSVRELAFQEATWEPQSEGERAHREVRKKNSFVADWCDLTDDQKAKWEARAIEVRKRKEAQVWGPSRVMLDGEYYVIDLNSRDPASSTLATTFKSKAEAMAWIQGNRRAGQRLDWGTNFERPR